MEFFQINIMVGIVGSDKCNAIVIFSLNFWLKYFYKAVIYAVDVFYQVNVLLIPLIGFPYY